ncbi:MAG: hypothetical protein HZA22_09110 [Nitrospirae bacterium]|nr:hypothetical protein [Nitrospirota bacterium]MBI5694324.1 hypothetical protein [Nitrospirota bacterium]
MPEDKMEARIAALEAELFDLKVQVTAIRRFISQNHPDMVKVLDGICDAVAREMKAGRGGA